MVFDREPRRIPRPSQQDLDTLGLTGEETYANARQRYLKLAKEHHPDKKQSHATDTGMHRAHADTVNINAAWTKVKPWYEQKTAVPETDDEGAGNEVQQDAMRDGTKWIKSVQGTWQTMFKSGIVASTIFDIYYAEVKNQVFFQALNNENKQNFIQKLAQDIEADFLIYCTIQRNAWLFENLETIINGIIDDRGDDQEMVTQEILIKLHNEPFFSPLPKDMQERGEEDARNAVAAVFHYRAFMRDWGMGFLAQCRESLSGPITRDQFNDCRVRSIAALNENIRRANLSPHHQETLKKDLAALLSSAEKNITEQKARITSREAMRAILKAKEGANMFTRDEMIAMRLENTIANMLDAYREKIQNGATEYEICQEVLEGEEKPLNKLHPTLAEEYRTALKQAVQNAFTQLRPTPIEPPKKTGFIATIKRLLGL